MQNENTNFIKELALEILVEAGFTEKETPDYDKLLLALEKRITSRTFLEMVSMLTPEQAHEINRDVELEESDPQKLILRLSQTIPDFQLRMAEVLSRIKMEIAIDLKQNPIA